MLDNIFDSRVCVVTGGANRTGRNIVLEFARRGANVAFMDLDAENGNALEKELREEYGSNVFFFHGDLCRKEDVEQFTAEVILRFDKIDYLINAACVSDHGSANGNTWEEMEHIMKRGMITPYMMTNLFRDYFYMGGCVVNIVSAVPDIPGGTTAGNQAAKAALISLTSAMAEQLQGKVRVNCVSPGWLQQEEEKKDSKKKLRSRIEPFDVTGTVMFLCEGKADCINGQNITVDGRMTRTMVYRGEDGWSFKKY